MVTMLNTNRLINDLQSLKFDGSLSVYKDGFNVNTNYISFNDIRFVNEIAIKYGMQITAIEIIPKICKFRIVVK